MFDLGKVIAHRGAAAYAPENTLAAFTIAKHCGAHTVEFDVMLTRCGETIVFHDETLQRTTNGRDKICDSDYAHLASLDAGSWFSQHFKGEPIPSLKQVLEALVELNLQANIEIKVVKSEAQQIAAAVVSQIKQYWPADTHLPLISSSNSDCLRAVRKLESRIPIGLLLPRWQENWQQLADELGCVAVHCDYLYLNEMHIQHIKNSGRLVLAYTVNSNADALRLFALGVDAVFSDYPDLLSM